MRRGRLSGWLLVLPALVLYGLFVIFPAVDALRLGFYDWSGFDFAKAKWVGLGNFRELAGDRSFLGALANNAILQFAGGAIAFPLAVAFAVGLGALPGPLKRLGRGVLLFPMAMSAIGVGLLWRYIADSEAGILTAAARGSGAVAPDGAVAWLGPRFGVWTLTAAYVWTYVGFYAALFRAAMDRIPTELVEAARLDGASETGILFRVTLPLLREVLLVAAILWIVGALRAFGVLYAITEGLSADLDIVGTYVYKVSFSARNISVLRMGYGCAMGCLLLLLVVAASAPAWIRRAKEGTEY